MHKSLLLSFVLTFTVCLCMAGSISYDGLMNNDPEFTTSACRSMDSSAIKYVVTGRPAPYNFEWMVLGTVTSIGTASLANNTDSINITGLDGTMDYVVVITDDMNTVICQDTFLFGTVELLAAQLTQNPTTMCAASATAQVIVGPNIVPNPSDNQYEFLWNNGETTQTANGLASGLVSVLVTSPEGCTTNRSFDVAGPANPLTIDNTPTITTPTCFGGDDGTIGINISGGNPSTGTTPYVIQWSTGGSDNFRNPLDNTENPIPSGSYSVTVTDSDQCQVTSTFTIEDPVPVSIDGFTNIAQSSCSQGACDGRAQVQVSGGSNPGAGYEIAWLNGETATTAILLCAGMNIVEVSNSGCPTVVDTIEITSPNEVSVVLIDSTNTRCYQQANGEIQVGGNGGTPDYTFNWDDAGTGDTRTNLLAGTYTVTATDRNGCTSDAKAVTITEPDSMEVIVELGGTINPRCNGDNNGVLSTRWIRGGNMATTPNYIWSANTPNPPNEPIATGLSAGTYSVTVTDGHGCQDETSYTLTTPPALIGQMTMPIEPSCFGDLTTVTVDTALGGTGTSFTFSVNNGPQQQLRNPNEVLAGTQIISVFDRNACRWDTTIMINQPAEVTVDIIDEITINLGDSAQLLPSVPMSVMIDSIIWTPLGNLTCADCLTPWVIPTQSDTYQVTVVDMNGCSGVDQIRVNLNKARNVFVPNVFSPNGDGINDFFQMGTGTGVNRINYLRVFDRWGELLYQQEDYLPGGGTDGWNGSLNGKNLNVGTYVFVSEVLFQDNTTLVYRGAVNLVR